MEESELIQLAKTDNSALEKLLSQYDAMLYSLVKNCSIKGYTAGDLMQESRIAFCQAVKGYDKEKGKLSTYAYLFVKRRLGDLKKASCVLKRRAEIVSIDSVDDDDLGFDLPSDKPTPEEIVLMEEERQELDKALRGKLTAVEFDVAMLFAKGYTYRDIAKLMSMTVKQVDNALQRARKKIQDKK